MAPLGCDKGKNVARLIADAIMSDQSPSAYRVLARKYRPDNFTGLIGQDALVRTLQNAITHGRLAHAFVLTGVRGVGKTSTARILARGLNCIGQDGTGGPTLNPCGACEPCQAIAGGRHVDVLEMDAASNTGVDDVRDIIEGAAYRPVSARFKIYIIDEVHMLSKSAFNALLKTLEEPPEAVKFIFATTEIRKVPVTILSRCQRFDLRRVTVDTLAAHLTTITEAEGISAEPEALHMIARAAEGSVRDSLSLLDQAAAMNADVIRADTVAHMLGHAGDQDVGDILQSALGGDVAAALAAFTRADNRGADAETIISDLLDLTHFASLDAAGSAMADLPESTASLTASLAKLGIAKLGRAWQILLKGHQEVKHAPNGRAAAQMLIIRLAHAAPMPTPAEIIAKLPSAPAGSSGPAAPTQTTASQTPAPSQTIAPQSQAPSPMPPVPSSGPHAQLAADPAPQPEPVTPQLHSLQQAVSLCEDDGQFVLAAHIRSYVQVISLTDSHLEISLADGAPEDLPAKMAKFLSHYLNHAFLVSLGQGPAEKTLKEQEEEAAHTARQEAAKDPLVAEIIGQFEGAEVTNIVPLADLQSDMSDDIDQSDK